MIDIYFLDSMVSQTWHANGIISDLRASTSYTVNHGSALSTWYRRYRRYRIVAQSIAFLSIALDPSIIIPGSIVVASW